MPPRSPAYEIVKGYLDEFPHAHTMTLARSAYADHPLQWATLEACRSAFRRARGNSGTANRVGHIEQQHYRPPQKPGDPFGPLPKGLKEIADWGPVVIGGPVTALVLADIHAPWHDDVALTGALAAGMDAGCDTVILNGDIADCHSVSKWETNPELRNFNAERTATCQVLIGIRERFPDARIVFKLGNHEERLERYLWAKAPELFGMPEWQMQNVLALDEHGMECVKDARPIRLGKLYVLHGHEMYGGTNTVNPARTLFLRGHVSALCSHSHRTSQHSEKDLAETVNSAWSTGCLCDLHPRYCRINKWNHGFAIVTVDGDGAFSVQNPRVVDGAVWS